MPILGADPGCAGEIISLDWLGDVLVSPQEELVRVAQGEEHLDLLSQTVAPPPGPG